VDWSNKVVLVTGGTGSFGKKFCEVMQKEYHPAKLIIYSRDELKQHEMRVAGFNDPIYRYFIGDVRDVSRLRRAFKDVDIVVHAAALKQVPACEYNPMEAIKTNILGSGNVIEAALDLGVDKVLALSTDKAVNPVNLYGATKLAAEKLFIQSNAYAAGSQTRFSCVRYGNVVGSRGSVVPVFLKQRENGKITITDKRMTRFWISLEQGVRFVIRCIEEMRPPNSKIEYIGIRPGEKLHEALISEDEARTTVELDDMFVVQPAEAFWFGKYWQDKGKELPQGYQYTSNNNTEWLNVEQIREIIQPIEQAYLGNHLE